jgi:predicted nucleic acid-binding protein
MRNCCFRKLIAAASLDTSQQQHLQIFYYISRKHTRSIERARQAVSETLATMVICPVNRAVLESAFTSGLADFEDAVQIACAVSQGLEAILTRDTQGFLSSSIPVLSIRELLQQLEARDGD